MTVKSLTLCIFLSCVQRRGPSIRSASFIFPEILAGEGMGTRPSAAHQARNLMASLDALLSSIL